MTKQELSTALAAKEKLSKSQATDAVEGFMDVLKDALNRGENIYLRGFGTFKIEKRAAKKARIISTGQTVTVPEHNVVKFIPSVELKKTLSHHG